LGTSIDAVGARLMDEALRRVEDSRARVKAREDVNRQRRRPLARASAHAASELQHLHAAEAEVRTARQVLQDAASAPNALDARRDALANLRSVIDGSSRTRPGVLELIPKRFLAWCRLVMLRLSRATLEGTQFARSFWGRMTSVGRLGLMACASALVVVVAKGGEQLLTGGDDIVLTGLAAGVGADPTVAVAGGLLGKLTGRLTGAS
jgi:hypothetical protein